MRTDLTTGNVVALRTRAATSVGAGNAPPVPDERLARLAQGHGRH
ncbi:MAG: hypothetical protein ACRDVP_11025 [Acidimicrobiales bacterium]